MQSGRAEGVIAGPIFLIVNHLSAPLNGCLQMKT
jgi:hypothetical protein